jgi:integrase/recombinase XerD
MSQLPSTSIFIDRYHPTKDGTCAVSIRVTHERKKRYYPTEFRLTPDDFDRVMSERPRNELKEIRIKLNHLEGRAVEVIKGLSFFNWLTFEKHFLRNRGTSNQLAYAFDEYIEVLKASDRFGSADTYHCAKRSLEEFRPKASFGDVNPAFLQKYESWMLTEGNSVTTVGIYLRSLRSLFNIAIADGIISKELYPFGKRKYEIPSANNIKKALSLSDIAVIYNFAGVEGSSISKAKDYWLFMYFCNGINVKDLCLLKYKNLQGNMISFERAKTSRTKRKLEPIRVVLIDELVTIIKRRGTTPAHPDNYIFPILTSAHSPQRQQQLVKLHTRFINDNMAKLRKEAGIEPDLTTYAARHSFASVLKRSGASTEFISEALGHTNLRTTQSYLASFEDDHKREVVKALTSFKSS